MNRPAWGSSALTPPVKAPPPVKPMPSVRAGHDKAMSLPEPRGHPQTLGPKPQSGVGSTRDAPAAEPVKKNARMPTPKWSGDKPVIEAIFTDVKIEDEQAEAELTEVKIEEPWSQRLKDEWAEAREPDDSWQQELENEYDSDASHDYEAERDWESDEEWAAWAAMEASSPEWLWDCPQTLADATDADDYVSDTDAF